MHTYDGTYVTMVSVYNSILDVAIYSNKSSIIIELNYLMHGVKGVLLRQPQVYMYVHLSIHPI